jgi:pyruvate/2-oxoglutarate dehydrogenase complex dihydrolipoamide acyltransferase (E2) component
MFRTLARHSKRITMPQLSPTHTSARILRFDVQNEQEVVAYDPVMIVECSPDLVTEGFRDRPDETVTMMVDTQEEGVVRDLMNDWQGKWIPVGAELGVIDDDDPVDGDWTWQANLDTNVYEE